MDVRFEGNEVVVEATEEEINKFFAERGYAVKVVKCEVEYGNVRMPLSMLGQLGIRAECRDGIYILRYSGMWPSSSPR